MTAHPAGYPPPPPQYAMPQPQPWRPPRWAGGFLAAVAFVIASGAAVWGSFEKIQTYRDEFPNPGGGNEVFGYTLYWWKINQVGPPTQPVSFPPYGVLLAVAAGLLVIGAFLAVTAFSNRKPGVVSAARVSAALGAGLLTGTVAVRFMDGLQALSETNARDVTEGETVTFDMGLGVWLPGGAAVLALIGAVLTWTRPKAVRVEPDTPRMGVPIPYGAQPYGQYQPYQSAPPAYQQVPTPTPTPTPTPQPAPTPTPPRPDPVSDAPQTSEQGDSPQN